MINAKKRKRTDLFSPDHLNRDPIATVFDLSPENVSARKVYVVGVRHDTAAFKLLEHFRKYGEVEEGPVAYDLGADSSTGYAVVLYRTVAGAAAALLDPVKIVDGKYLYCKGH